MTFTRWLRRARGLWLRRGGFKKCVRRGHRWRRQVRTVYRLRSRRVFRHYAERYACERCGRVTSWLAGCPQALAEDPLTVAQYRDLNREGELVSAIEWRETVGGVGSVSRSMFEDFSLREAGENAKKKSDA